jgi:hypothetical protein
MSTARGSGSTQPKVLATSSASTWWCTRRDKPGSALPSSAASGCPKQAIMRGFGGLLIGWWRAAARSRRSSESIIVRPKRTANEHCVRPARGDVQKELNIEAQGASILSIILSIKNPGSRHQRAASFRSRGRRITPSRWRTSSGTGGSHRKIRMFSAMPGSADRNELTISISRLSTRMLAMPTSFESSKCLRTRSSRRSKVNSDSDDASAS